jgi:NADH dehydrogenase (ubiquinone) flavoprotein 2
MLFYCQYLFFVYLETSSDNLFTLNEVECLGACANAPMMQVNNHEFYENLTPENTIQLLTNLKNGTAKEGPQTSQKNCEGPLGKTSLFDKPVPPPCRDFKQLAEQVKADAEKAKAAAAAQAAAPKTS